MPTLPTLTVTQAQADRIIAAFGAGGTQADAVARYKEWLRNEIVRYTQEAELGQLRVKHQREESLKQQEIMASMPPEVAPPAEP